ncbi:MAG: sigma 54-interacting transcriptional regulator [Deltaproteobacteria bacterium]|nr:sigma 54-interacting transcriptional regulator [Deltaproteobacteria bacterium]
MDDPSTVAHAPGVRLGAGCFEVRVTAGIDEGKSLAVSPRSAGRLLVGTSESCALRLGDRRASRRHLALDVEGGLLRVTDLGSTNGTTVNGLRVMDVLCQGGEIVVIGDTTLRVDVDRVDAETPDVRMAWGPVIGASLAMRRLYRTCDALARSRAPLLVEGEPGTGKIALAEALHGDASKPFVVVEGASFASDDALLSEAAGGTLLVHEVADVPFERQVALAALVARAKTSDVRLVATTCKNLDAAVEGGTFKEELLRELSSRIELPPLRDRRGDIALLVEHFARRLGATSAAIPPKKLGILNRAPFPGNVRELERTVTLLLADAGAKLPTPAEGDTAAAASPAAPPTPESLDLEVTYRDLLVANLPFAEAKQKVLDRFASAYVVHAVAAHGGHVAKAAAASGLAPRYFNLLRARSRGSKG